MTAPTTPGAPSTTSSSVHDRVPCPACRTGALVPFYEQERVPVHSCLLLDDREAARRFPTGAITLARCGACGFVANTRFRPDLVHYTDGYEETQEYSPRFNAFARGLALEWIDRYGLHHRKVLEIGCGKGSFLEMLCELADADGVGLDPTYEPTRGRGSPRVTFRRELYDERYGPIDADAVVCRHTLEHVPDVGRFVRTVRRGIGDRRDVVVLFEVPDTRRVLDEAAFWDVYHEHCSYFTAGSLARTFRHAGFDVLDVRRDFDDQYLVLEARPASSPPDRSRALAPLSIEDDLVAVEAGARHFADTVGAVVGGWRDRIHGEAAAGRRVVVWGGGSKGVAFLTTLGVGTDVAFVVDVNPYKQGRYLAGTGHAVVGPEHLRVQPPDLVVVMNAIYRDEISAMLRGRAVAAEVVTV